LCKLKSTTRSWTLRARKLEALQKLNRWHHRRHAFLVLVLDGRVATTLPAWGGGEFARKAGQVLNHKLNNPTWFISAIYVPAAAICIESLSNSVLQVHP
jgi:hypothetical protein